MWALGLQLHRWWRQFCPKSDLDGWLDIRDHDIIIYTKQSQL